MSIRSLLAATAALVLTAAACTPGAAQENPSPTPTLSVTVAPDPSPTGERYTAEVFPSFTIDRDVTYGTATTQAGTVQDLKMDVLEPEGDTETDRPLVILAHGGGFTSGDKVEQSQFLLGPMLARSGYVVASINYRLVDVPADTQAISRGVIDAVHDMKAAVRYFRASAEDGNPYGINPDEIFIGGYSAGAFTSLHAGYIGGLDEVGAVDPAMAEYLTAAGGIEGNSGTPGYPSDVAGVINISGALVDADLVDRGEPPLFSIHGTGDAVVPFLEGDANNTGVITQGSGLIHPRALEQGVPSELLELDGVGHFPFLVCDGCDDRLREFLAANLG